MDKPQVATEMGLRHKMLQNLRTKWVQSTRPFETYQFQTLFSLLLHSRLSLQLKMFGSTH